MALKRQNIALKGDVIMIYAAKNWLAPRAEYVCAQADSGLPFSDLRATYRWIEERVAAHITLRLKIFAGATFYNRLAAQSN